MNKLVLSIVLTLSSISFSLSAKADESNAAADANAATVGAVLAEGLKVMADNGWGAADVADAIKSVRGLYVRDNATTEGRKRWNGRIISTTIDTNTWTKTTVYENGRVFVDKASGQSPASKVKKANSKLTTVISNGVPAALAAARSRRAAEVANGPTNVTISISAGAQ